MNKRQYIAITKYNKLLESSNQKLRVISMTVNELLLNNGLIIRDKIDIRKFKQRVRNNNMYIIYFDAIYKSTYIDIQIEKECKLMIHKKGGVCCQQKHGDKIKNNLNTGIPWNTGTKGLVHSWNKGLTKDTHPSLKKLSDDRKGIGNPRYGISPSQESRDKQRLSIKKRILDGSFTPNIHNSHTHWQISYNGQKYRSSWELLFHMIHPECEYEKIRIPYIYDNKERIYITDFVSYVDRKVFEIKPKSHHNNILIKTKFEYAHKWCDKNNFNFVIIDEDYLFSFISNVDLNLIDIKTRGKLKKSYETYKHKRNRKTR